jgi:EmrB/QacA subfamily drug resistance transporter
MAPMTLPEESLHDESYKWKALAPTAMGMFMATMDASITNIAFPILIEALHTDLPTVVWVTLAFTLVCTSSMLVLGKISDHAGRKRIYSIGMCVFTAGMGACAVSQTIGQLLLFRAVQAIGAAMTIATSTAIVTEAFPAKETGKGIGLLGIFVSLGFITGPVLGGILLSWLDWRALFYMRVPLGVLTCAMSFALLKKDTVREKKMSIDITGALLSSFGFFTLILGVSQIKTLDAISPLVYLLVGLGLLSLTLFVFHERRALDPIVDFSLFKNRIFSTATWSLFLVFISAPPFILIIPFYLMEGLGLTPSSAGILISVNSMTTIISGPVSGSLSDRFGPFWFSVLGGAAMTIAFLFMLGFNLDTGMATIVFSFVALGIGIGLFNPSNNSLVMGSVTRDRLGMASALIATVRQVGLSLGTAIAGATFSAGLVIHKAQLRVQGLDGKDLDRYSIPPAFHDVLWISIILGVVVIGLSVWARVKYKGHLKPS